MLELGCRQNMTGMETKRARGKCIDNVLVCQLFWTFLFGNIWKFLVCAKSWIETWENSTKQSINLFRWTEFICLRCGISSHHNFRFTEKSRVLGLYALCSWTGVRLWVKTLLTTADWSQPTTRSDAGPRSTVMNLCYLGFITITISSSSSPSHR